jgi:hypothetical protein
MIIMLPGFANHAAFNTKIFLRIKAGKDKVEMDNQEKIGHQESRRATKALYFTKNTPYGVCLRGGFQSIDPESGY